ncbi:cytochrome P450 [Rickenella mellea]|uniref:Cytochrome P450 n=1 Tax=Rickenella mellea TaxID=50990 RepID=A0A4Y7PPH8_9AGAM|nr:cytochrome P450 [Rickenella mellea]
MAVSYNTADLLVLAGVVVSLVAVRLYQLRSRKLPPGPRASFWAFGVNKALRKKPTEHVWKTFSAWGKQYGPLISYYLGNKPVIVITKADLAWELLEKRGDIYSDRPRQVMAQELLSRNLRLLGQRYGERFKKLRTIQTQGMSGHQALTYRQMQTYESAVLMRDILQDPAAISTHIQRFATSIVFSISYGTRIQNLDAEIVENNNLAVNHASRYMKPGAYIADTYPSLLWLPKPLQWFRYEPERLHKWMNELYIKLFREVAVKMENGTVRECASSRALTPGKSLGLTETELAWAVSAPFTAGVDTTKASSLVFILEMLHHPHIMKKAQEEIDRVIGDKRMPAFADEDQLPYLAALMKESLRWIPIAPSGVPHAVTKDDYFNGYFIPKGATVFANLRDMMYDPELFPDPEVFRPERFLDTKNPRLIDFNLPFGFGRRICPGLHVASQSLWIFMARLLWAYDILPALDADKKPVLPDLEAFVGMLVVQPARFECRFVPRRPDVVTVIEAEGLEADIELKAWD